MQGTSLHEQQSLLFVQINMPNSNCGSLLRQTWQLAQCLLLPPLHACKLLADTMFIRMLSFAAKHPKSRAGLIKLLLVHVTQSGKVTTVTEHAALALK